MQLPQIILENFFLNILVSQSLERPVHHPMPKVCLYMKYVLIE